MSYHVRINSPDDAYLMVERGVTELGYSGTICKLPPAMARGYDERVRHIRDEELGPDADFKVFPDFATRPKRQPVLVVMPYVEGEPAHYPSDRMAAIAADSGMLHVTIDGREGHFDAAEWVAALGDGLRPLVDDFVRHWAEDVGAAWALVEADRRGLEPTPVEVSDVEVGNGGRRGAQLEAGVDR